MSRVEFVMRGGRENCEGWLKENELRQSTGLSALFSPHTHTNTTKKKKCSPFFLLNLKTKRDKGTSSRVLEALNIIYFFFFEKSRHLLSYYLCSLRCVQCEKKDFGGKALLVVVLHSQVLNRVTMEGDAHNKTKIAGRQ